MRLPRIRAHRDGTRAACLLCGLSRWDILHDPCHGATLDAREKPVDWGSVCMGCAGHDILMATMLNGAAVMDGALLLIAANETCPQPQTSEHLAAVEIMRLEHIIILQNKIDLIRSGAMPRLLCYHEVMTSMASCLTQLESTLQVCSCLSVFHCISYQSELSIPSGIVLVLGMSLRQHVRGSLLCCSESAAQNQSDAIQDFIKGTIAEKAPIVPISAQLKYNVDAVCEYIVKRIPVPVRDFTSPPQMIVIRSFDVNKPGSEVEELRGGVAGGSILQVRNKVAESTPPTRSLLLH